MANLNPLKLLLWTFRRSPADVIDLYNTLSPLMQLATGGSMLNFGYWKDASEPVAAQEALCSLVGQVAELGSANRLIDLGSGLGAPARFWLSEHPNLKVVCVNINRGQLAESSAVFGPAAAAACVNATSTSLPVQASCADRVAALESAQHFRPLEAFAGECSRALSPGGVLAVAIPVTSHPLDPVQKLLRLGILSFTWSSEHYSAAHVRSALESAGFKLQVRSIGHEVYEPLADYYVSNRQSIRAKIGQRYPAYLEAVLYSSLLKMRQASEKGLIDYLVIKATKVS